MAFLKRDFFSCPAATRRHVPAARRPSLGTGKIPLEIAVYVMADGKTLPKFPFKRIFLQPLLDFFVFFFQKKILFTASLAGGFQKILTPRKIARKLKLFFLYVSLKNHHPDPKNGQNINIFPKKMTKFWPTPQCKHRMFCPTGPPGARCNPSPLPGLLSQEFTFERYKNVKIHLFLLVLRIVAKKTCKKRKHERCKKMHKILYPGIICSVYF